METSAPPARSILSLDVGRRRIGLAGCDPLGVTVTPLPAILRRHFDQDLNIIKAHCKNRAVKGLVVGMPLDREGQPTQQAMHCQRYGQRLSRALQLPMALVNEQCSSWVAAEKGNMHGDRTGRLDSAAAVLLLDQWLREGPDLELDTSERKDAARRSLMMEPVHNNISLNEWTGNQQQQR